MSSMVIQDVRWFSSGRGLVGVVRVEMDDDQGEGPEPRRVIRYFIGPVTGYNEELDKQTIADWGARFDDAAGDVLFGQAKGVRG